MTYSLLSLKSINSFSVQGNLDNIRDFGLSCIYHFVQNGNGVVLVSFWNGFSQQPKYKNEFKQAIKSFGFDSSQLLSIETAQSFTLSDKQKNFVATMRSKLLALKHFGFEAEHALKLIEAIFWDKSVSDSDKAIKVANEALVDYSKWLKEQAKIKEAKSKSEAEAKAKAKAKAKVAKVANVAQALLNHISGAVVDVPVPAPALAPQSSPTEVVASGDAESFIKEWANEGIKSAVGSSKLSKKESDQLKALLLKLAA